jgi:predicted phosphodiesterase
MKKQTILVIGDLHSPAMHKDTVPFLAAIKKKFKPTEVILTGDEINFESFSYHEHNPDLPGPADELKQGIDALKPIYKLFPVARILESNHTSLIYRKQV